MFLRPAAVSTSTASSSPAFSLGSRGDHVVLATPEGYRGKNVIARFWEHRRALPRSRSPAFRRSTRPCSTRRRRHDLSSLEFAICGAAPMPAELISGFEAQDRGEDHRRIRPDGRRLRLRRQPARRRALRGLHRSAPPLSADDRRRCWTTTALPSEGWPSTRSGSSRINGPNVFEAISIRGTTRGSGSTSTARSWLNTGDLGRGMRTAISGSPAGRRS